MIENSWMMTVVVGQVVVGVVDLNLIHRLYTIHPKEGFGKGGQYRDNGLNKKIDNY
jgi:hypothetical protein